jgi:hypothetical protein
MVDHVRRTQILEAAEATLSVAELIELAHDRLVDINRHPGSSFPSSN